jgi:hypothetical protein
METKTGIQVEVPEVCDICGSYAGQAYDVHMVLAHPETRIKPEREIESEKPKKKKKNAV